MRIAVGILVIHHDSPKDSFNVREDQSGPKTQEKSKVVKKVYAEPRLVDSSCHRTPGEPASSLE